MIHVEFTVTRTHLVSLLGLLVLAVVLIPAVARGSHQFTDVSDGNIFHTDIAWMADEGITMGCNPPTNDMYCPNTYVTRGQMAAFMHRLHTNKIAPLETLLAGVTRNGDTLKLTGMNLQVVNGQGTSATSNGLGNVIIGYNEDTGTPEARTGSHYLIVGDENDWTSYGGIVAGYRNTVSGIYGSVTGGDFNTAGGDYSSVTSGYANTAAEEYASVSGGRFIEATGWASSVFGGQDNIAGGTRSSVSGGQDNTAGGNFSSVSGGRDNVATGLYASVSGGSLNDAQGDYSSVSGGWWNFAKGSYSSILGGANNTVTAGYGIYPI